MLRPFHFMKYNLLITSSPLQTHSAHTAFRFATAALSMNHTLEQVFFIQAAVDIIHPLQTDADEFNAHQAWLELAEKVNIPLHLCINACHKRGLLNDNDALNPQFNAKFISSGLVQYFNACQQADRSLTF